MKMSNLMILNKTGKLSTLEEVCRALKKYDHFLLSPHIRPEGDAVGSVLAIKYLLNHLGKKSWVVCQDEFPKRLDIMPQKGWHTVRDIKGLTKPPRFQACVVVDCPNPTRLGTVQSLMTPEIVIINIDHHVSNQLFGHVNLVNDRASSCGEIVYDLYKRLKVPVTREAALPMYVSISTDTGSFRFGNTTERTHVVASQLIKTGICVENISENLYERYSHMRLNLLADLLDHMKVECKGKVVWAIISKKMMAKTGSKFEDTEGFVDFLRSMDGVSIAFILIELDGGRYQVSFRAKGSNDVNQIAEQFGGGGHRKASGCSLEGSPEKNGKKILSAIRFYLKRPTFSRSKY